ncbi:SRPBCC family protein [Rhodococcus sp. 27YEA15]|uniref:SRPBCC family protein n=1 Tax=Rhodococcus sp. 27YEA15 TaxID=3156259 RepID=UPI003C7AEBD4
MTVDVRRTFTVDRPIEEVVNYLRNFAHAVEWDPGTQTCTQLGGGPVVRGTRWRNVSKLFGISTELTYELVLDQPDRIVFEGSNKTADSTDDLAFESTGESTTITYQAHIEFKKWAFLIDPIAQRAFERVGDKTVDQITDRIRSL